MRWNPDLEAAIAKEAGVKGFYKGSVATLTRDVLWNFAKQIGRDGRLDF